MVYRALKSFCGVINMRRGEIKEINNSVVADDLLKCGYIEGLEEETETEKPAAKRGRKAKQVEV